MAAFYPYSAFIRYPVTDRFTRARVIHKNVLLSYEFRHETQGITIFYVEEWPTRVRGLAAERRRYKARAN